MPTDVFLDEFFPNSPNSDVGFKEFGIDPTRSTRRNTKRICTRTCEYKMVDMPPV